MSRENIAKLAVRNAASSKSSGVALEMICALVEEGVIALDTPAEGSRGVMDCLLRYAFMIDLKQPSTIPRLFMELFHPDHVARFLQVSNGTAFSQKNSQGEPVVRQAMKVLWAVQQATRIGAGDPAKKAHFDAAFARMLSPILQDHPKDLALWLKDAFEMGLPETVDVLWPHVPPLTLVGEGASAEPVILSAKTAAHWNRFISENGSAATLVRGQPLYRVLLDACAKDGMRAESSFLGAFEHWMIANAPKDPEMQKSIQALAIMRVRKAPKQTPTAHWVNILKAAPCDWPLWQIRENPKEKQSANSVPLWATIAAARGLEFIDALANEPVLANRLPAGLLDAVRLQMLLANMKHSSLAVEAVKAMERAINVSGFVPGLTPYVLDYSSLPLERASLRTMESIVKAHSLAWWGDPATQEATERALVLGMPKLSREAKNLTAWLALSAHPNPGPHLKLAHHLGHCLRGNWEEALSLDPGVVGPLLVDPVISEVMHKMASSFPTARKAAYATWFDSAKLHGASPQAPAARRSVRL